jgi:hypothetical protein
MGRSKFLKANCRGGLSAQQQRRRYYCRVFRVELARLEALVSLGPRPSVFRAGHQFGSVWTSRVRVADQLATKCRRCLEAPISTKTRTKGARNNQNAQNAIKEVP